METCPRSRKPGRVVVVAIAIGLAAFACVKNDRKSGGGGVGAGPIALEPVAVSIGIGKSRIFRIESPVPPQQTLIWGVTGGGELQTVPAGGHQIRFVGGATPGTHVLQVAWLNDPTQWGSATITLNNYEFGFSVPVPVPGGNESFVAGDLTIVGNLIYVLTSVFGGPDLMQLQTLSLADSSVVNTYTFPQITTAGAIAVDSSGAAYVLVAPGSGVFGTTSYELIKFDADLNPIPAQTPEWNPPTGIFDSVAALAADSQGFIYAFTRVGGPLEDPAILKLDATGAVVETFESPTIESFCFGAMTIDELGNIFIAGCRYTNGDQSIMKLLPTGELDPTFAFTLTTPGVIEDITVDEEGAIFFSVRVFPNFSGGAPSGYIQQLSANGIEIGARIETYVVESEPNPVPFVAPISVAARAQGDGVSPNGTIFVLEDVFIAPPAPVIAARVIRLDLSLLPTASN
ncbi:MAG: hypothetical protein ACKVX7_19125 [Planctomycetota bacterium]